MKQRDMLLSKFNLHGNVLTTADFASDRQLSCEYRRLLCQLREEGYEIVKTKIENNLFRYELRQPDNTGQYQLPI